MTYYTWADLSQTPMTPQIRRRLVTGEKLMSVYFNLDKGAIVGEHKHPHEQITHIIAGQIEVIAAQSAQAPAIQRSWQSGEMITAEMNTFAEGVATRVPFTNTQRIMRKYLDDFVLVDDADIKKAIVLLLEYTRNLAEGAGAVSLAAALQLKERLVGKKVVLILSGGNLSLEKLRNIVAGA